MNPHFRQPAQLWLALFTATLLVAAAQSAYAQPAVVLPTAKGVYRMPFANTTEVRVSNDHVDHSPQNRIDMSGSGNPTGAGGKYVVVAAAAGWIEYIAEDNNTFCPKAADGCDNYNGPTANCCVRSDNSCNSNCINNFIWIRHANGEWSKYTHIQTNSASLFGRSVNEYVTAGTPLGYQGDVGIATGPHLHFEVARPDSVDLSDDANPLGLSANNLPSGWLNDNDGYAGVDRQNRIPVFCQQGFLSSGAEYTAAACDDLCGAIDSTVSGTIADDSIFHKQASNSIGTSGSGFQVNAGGGASLTAGSRVTLSPGFSVAETGSFTASTGACDTPGGTD
jgi:hypothetical protein